MVVVDAAGFVLRNAVKWSVGRRCASRYGLATKVECDYEMATQSFCRALRPAAPHWTTSTVIFVSASHQFAIIWYEYVSHIPYQFTLTVSAKLFLSDLQGMLINLTCQNKTCRRKKTWRAMACHSLTQTMSLQVNGADSNVF